MPVSLQPFDGTVTLNALTNGVTALGVGEFARVNLVSPGVWDMHVFPLPVSGAGATALAGLSDVDLVTTPPNAGDALTYDGAMWLPQPAGTVGPFPPYVKGWGALGGATTIPRASALGTWAEFAFPIADTVTFPVAGFPPMTDNLSSVNMTVVAPDLTPGFENPGQTKVAIQQNGIYLINVKGRLRIDYTNLTDAVTGFVRIYAHALSSDAAENQSGNRVVGFIDIADPFSLAQRALNFGNISGTPEVFMQDFNAVWQWGTYYGNIYFKVANFLTDAAGNTVSPAVTLTDTFIKVTYLADANFQTPA
jgi:hypothetical protein